jgi:hypothetical protein
MTKNTASVQPSLRKVIFMRGKVFFLPRRLKGLNLLGEGSKLRIPKLKIDLHFSENYSAFCYAMSQSIK